MFYKTPKKQRNDKKKLDLVSWRCLVVNTICAAAALVARMKNTVQELINARARSRLFSRWCCCQEKTAKVISYILILGVMAAYAYTVVRQL